MAKRAPLKNISTLARRYISENVSIKTCLRRGLVNYSALAREICDEYGLSNFEAVVVACRRYAARLRGSTTYDARIVALIKKARIRVRTKVAVIIMHKVGQLERLDAVQQTIRRQRGDFTYIEGETADVVVTNAEFADLVRAEFRKHIVKISEDLAQITMIFDERIEITPGVVAYIYGLLADHDINIVEEMSCWRDLMLFVREEDMGKATQLLSLKT